MPWQLTGAVEVVSSNYSLTTCSWPAQLSEAVFGQVHQGDGLIKGKRRDIRHDRLDRPEAHTLHQLLTLLTHRLL